MTSHMLPTDRSAWLKGNNIHCRATPPISPKLRRLVLLGAPGVGKGTQAELLSRHLGLCHLSTGDIFRAAKNADEGEPTPAMKSALDSMRRGELVADDTVVALVAERSSCFRCGGGFLLDGFPRTVAQAEALERVLAAQHVALDAVLNYELSLKSIVARLSGRRTCLKCKAVFHVQARPPLKTGICDHCGSPLYQREDDHPESIRVRMDAYQRSTSPVAGFYRHKNLLVSISATGTAEDIFTRTLEALQTDA
jgi:adenylate kinase